MAIAKRVFRVFFPKALLAAILVFSVSKAHAGPPLDAESMECINCHRVNFSGTAPMMICHGEECDHPIGVDYALAISLNRGGLKPIDQLNPRIRLVDNKIGCTTCHIRYDVSNHRQLFEQKQNAPHLPNPFLSVDNGWSGLCLACHVK